MAARKVPRGTFWIGGAMGLALALPLLSMLLYAAAHAVGVGDPQSGIQHIWRIALAFAGFPAFLTGGGVARLAAHRIAEEVPEAGPLPKRAMVVGALAMGAGGIGLAYLTAVPLGGMPEQPLRWIWLAVAGLAAGALTGLAIGGLVGVRQRKQIVPVVEPEPEPQAEPVAVEPQPEPEPEPEPEKPPPIVIGEPVALTKKKKHIKKRRKHRKKHR